VGLVADLMHALGLRACQPGACEPTTGPRRTLPPARHAIAALISLIKHWEPPNPAEPRIAATPWMVEETPSFPYWQPKTVDI